MIFSGCYLYLFPSNIFPTSLFSCQDGSYFKTLWSLTLLSSYCTGQEVKDVLHHFLIALALRSGSCLVFSEHLLKTLLKLQCRQFLCFSFLSRQECLGKRMKALKWHIYSRNKPCANALCLWHNSHQFWFSWGLFWPAILWSAPAVVWLLLFYF